MRAQHIPGIESPPFWCRKWFLETLGAVPVTLAAGFTAYKFWQTPEDRNLAWVAIGVVAWVAIVSFIKILAARRQDKREGPAETHDGLYAAISVLHSAIKHAVEARLGPNLDLRMTFHRVVPPLDNPKTIEQIIPYVGWTTSGQGRSFSVNTGITGQAIRNKEPHIMASNAGSDTEHRRELVANWGYTASQAAGLSPGRYSAAAIPVLDKSGQHVLGVIYSDASDSHVFDETATKQMLIAVCNSIGSYVTQRY